MPTYPSRFGLFVPRLVAGIALLSGMLVTPAFGQNLATWSFGSTATPISVTSSVTVPNAIFTTPTPVTNISGSRFSCQGWDIATLDPARFFEVKIIPDNTYKLTATQYAVNMERTAASGPTNYEIRVSLDGFSSFTAISSGPLPQNTVTNISVPISTVVQTTTTLSIRVFFWGATVAARTVSIGSTSISGSILALALPVGLISFLGKTVGTAVQLTWATAWEQNADRYVVQRSPDALDFLDIGMLRAAGNTDGQRTYTLTDDGPDEGVNYYRLKQLDEDGTFVYSKLVAVQVRSAEPLVRVFPNPSDGRQIQAHLRGLTAPTVSIYALTGQQVPGIWLLKSPTAATWQPDAPLLPGLYLFSVRDGAVSQTIKVLVE